MLLIDEVMVLTLDTAKQALARTVDKYGPDNTYALRARNLGQYDTSGCSYTGMLYVEGQPITVPLCLIGVMLVEEFNVPISTFTCDLSQNNNNIDSWLRKNDIPGYDAIEKKAIDFLQAAQWKQDAKETWGYAYQYASEQFPSEVEQSDQNAKETPSITKDPEAYDKAVQDSYINNKRVLIHYLMDLGRYDDEVLTCIRNEQKVQGIKRLRQMHYDIHGSLSSLMESKSAYEALADEYNNPPF